MKTQSLPKRKRFSGRLLYPPWAERKAPKSKGKGGGYMWVMTQLPPRMPRGAKRTIKNPYAEDRGSKVSKLPRKKVGPTPRQTAAQKPELGEDKKGRFLDVGSPSKTGSEKFKKKVRKKDHPSAKKRNARQEGYRPAGKQPARQTKKGRRKSMQRRR